MTTNPSRPSPTQSVVKGDEATGFGLRKRYVLSFVGLTQPNSSAISQAAVARLSGRCSPIDNLPGQEALQRKLRESVRDFAAERHLVPACSPSLSSESSTTKLASTTSPLSAIRESAGLQRRHLASARRSASPPHPAGSGAISGFSSATVETTIRARAASASSRSRISRSSFPFAITGRRYWPYPRFETGLGLLPGEPPGSGHRRSQPVPVYRARFGMR